jgi:hypothetical protein
MKKKARYMIPVLGFLLVFATSGPNGQKENSEHEAQLLSFEDLAYPGIARMTRIQGIVIIRSELDENGEVVKASALSGPKPLISDCLSNAKKWKFKPNSGKYALVVYEFRLDDGACHDASHSLFRLIHPNFATITACSPILN